MAEHSEALVNLFKAKLKKARKGAITGGIVLGVICLFILVMAIFFPGDSSDRIYRNIFLIGAGLGLSATYYFTHKQYTRLDPETSELSIMAENLNADNNFVWIYPYKLVYNGIPSYAIIFKTKDKEEFRISVSETEQRTILTMLQLSIKNVTYGYSDEKKRLYKKNPENLQV